MHNPHVTTRAAQPPPHPPPGAHPRPRPAPVAPHPSWTTADYVQSLWAANAYLTSILRAPADLESTREEVFRYLERRERRLLEPGHSTPRLVRLLTGRALRVLRNIIGPIHEKRTGTSALRALSSLAHDDDISDPPTPGFVMEFIHLFRAVGGYPDLYEGDPFRSEEVHDPPPASSEQRANARTRMLDEWAERVRAGIQRYPSGLEPEIREIRAKNRARISGFFGCTSAEWNTYQWQIRNVISDGRTLSRLVELSDDEVDAIERARTNGIPFGITPYYVSLMDVTPSDRDHAVRAQVIPPGDYVSCMIEHAEDRSTVLDFMGEHETSPVDLVTRRYPEIAILKPFNTCAQICVYCQRNWEIDGVLSPSAMASRDRLDRALTWIERNPAIREILVTGGDPCLMSDATMFRLLERLAQTPQITRIRIGTRTPVVLPMRWTNELAGVLSQFHEPGLREVAVVTHFEHSYEITPEAMDAVQRIRQTGISVYNQEVFTVENSRRFETAKLRKDLRLIGVDPYYTFNMKGKSELRRYRVPIARLLQERREEARLMPGLDRTDEPVFNVPRLGKSHLRAGQDHRLIMVRNDGARVYEFDPWEKGIALSPTYLFTDVSIYEYLVELSSRGEDPTDYRSIWYYY